MKKNEIKSNDGPIKDKLISNTIYLFLDWASLSVIGFFFWFIAGKFLLPVEYGIVSTSVNLALLVGSASLLGLHFTVWKLIPEFLGRREHMKINSLIKSSMKFVLISNSIILVTTLMFSSFISSVLKMPVNVLLISVLALFSYSVALQFRYIIYSFQEMKVLAITDIIGQVGKLVISLALILFGFKYFGPLIGFLLGNVIMIILRFRYIPLKLKTGKIDEKSIMLTYAIPAFIITLCWLVFINGQYILITALKGPEVTGIYAVAMVLTSYLVVIPTTLNSALIPITSSLSIESDAKVKQSRLIGLVLRYSLLITIPLAVLLVLFSEPAILIFSRAEYVSASQFIPLLAFASLIQGISGIFLDNIYAVGQPKVNRNILIFGTLIFLLSAGILIHLFSALGSAIAYTISAVFLVLVSYMYLRNKIKLGFPFKGLAKLILSAAFSFGLLYLIMGYVHDFKIRILFALMSCMLYLIVLLPIKFYKDEDIKVLEFFSTKIPIIGKYVVKLQSLLSKFKE